MIVVMFGTFTTMGILGLIVIFTHVVVHGSEAPFLYLFLTIFSLSVGLTSLGHLIERK